MKTKYFILIFISLWCLSIKPCGASSKLRVISLTPATTEILFALGLDNEIVGVSSFCDYPAAATKKEKVGTFSYANIEKIVSLKPDIIFCTGLEQAPLVTKLKQLGLQVYVCDPANFEELFASILEMGRLTSRENQARKLTEKMRSFVSAIKEKSASLPDNKRPRVFVEIWNDPLMTAGEASFIDELINIAGGINVARAIHKAYSNISPEYVIKKDPQVIILGYMTPELPVAFLQARLGWKNVSAVKNSRVYSDIDPNVLFRPGPRLIEALQEIHKKLYLS